MDSLHTLLLSTREYVTKHIHNDKNAYEYNKTMSDIYVKSLWFHSAKSFKEFIYREYTQFLGKKKPFTIFSDPSKYKRLAYEHGLDICNSIVMRFEHGGEGKTFFVKGFDYDKLD